MSLARYSTIKKVFIKNIKKNKKKYNLLVLKKIEKKTTVWGNIFYYYVITTIPFILHLYPFPLPLVHWILI